MGGWVGAWVGERVTWVEEEKAVEMRCWTSWVGGRVEEEEVVGLSYWTPWVGGWVGGRTMPVRVETRREVL